MYCGHSLTQSLIHIWFTIMGTKLPMFTLRKSIKNNKFHVYCLWNEFSSQDKQKIKVDWFYNIQA